MNKLSKDKRDKLIIVALATIGAVGLLYTFVIGAQKEKLADYQNKIKQLQDKVSKAELWGQMAPKIEARLQESNKALDIIQANMAPADRVKWFYDIINSFADERGVRLTSISSPSPEDVLLLPKFPYQAASFTLKATAHYHDLGKFLADFENKFVYMRLQITKIEREAGGGMPAAPNPAIAQRPGSASAPTASMAVTASDQLSIEMKIVTLVKPGTPK